MVNISVLFGLCLAAVASAAPPTLGEFPILPKAQAALPVGRAFHQEPVVVREKIHIPSPPVLEPLELATPRVHAPLVRPAGRVPTIQRTVPDVSRTFTASKRDGKEDAIIREQAETAHYSFATSVDDTIMGHAHARTETRDGLHVDGMYSYSDGFFRRTIQYEADDKGFRIVKEVIEPIGDGPIIDPHGQAVVRSSLGTEYTITAADIADSKIITK